MKRLILTVALIAAGATAASAYGTSTREVDSRQAQQEQRIRDGVRDGSLSRRETRELVNEQRHIQHLESKVKADGVVTRGEAAELRRAQDNASKHIYQERHDSDTRNRFGFRRWW